ncbi:prolyl oligopeptidase [Clonorchis sinensis]|uniref:Prolyl oligopeptidase n=1 Tax=Clonorchis sinensis TaxID=79923 RepID=G7Y551_CLOSI|nr:prolyl oligopeptidase [Clonorchis sinensis]
MNASPARSNPVDIITTGETADCKTRGFSMHFKCATLFSVLFQLESLDGTASVFLDPNEIDADGLAAIRSYSFSEEGSYLCYGLSHGGSDWAELKVGPLVPFIKFH